MCTKVLFLILTLLFFEKCTLCYGMVIQSPSVGGEIQGDPAPGRSPGPPAFLAPKHKSKSDSKLLATTILPASLATQNCSLDGDAVDDPRGLVNITVTHRLFKSEWLVAGINYQVYIECEEDVFPLEFTLTALIQDEPIGYFKGPELLQSNCGPNYVKGVLHSSLHFNWTYGGPSRNIESKTTIIFMLRYRQLKEDSLIHQKPLVKQFIKDCRLWLKPQESSLSWKDFPRSESCQTWFPGHDVRRGLVIELVRLNVPCSKGYLYFSGLNNTQHQYIKNHKQSRLCGKLEELTDADRHIYFPWSHMAPFFHIHGYPTFAFSYKLVDYCYNITFVTRNGTFELKPSGDLECTFKIYLPYGNRVALTLQIGDSTSTGIPDTNTEFAEHDRSDLKCVGLLTQLLDGENSWWHCTRAGDAEKQIQILSRGNKVVLKVSVKNSSGSALGLKMMYKAESVNDVVGRCGFGWVAIRQFCVTAIESLKLPWNQAEVECTIKGGHLISIRNEYAQDVVDNLLRNSPGYREDNAYWIGASDKALEGDFRWNDGLAFSYSNWFPGWSQHGNYNRQPNDDGLSEQDCVEIRKTYSLPTSSVRLAKTFMWNDRDCAAANFFICERLQSDEPLEDNWQPDCNRSVTLSRQHPRTTITSPSFPRPYPDNIYCETEISAPPGYRLVLDFEELVLESEPSCSYDFLEILENFYNSSSYNGSGSGRRLCGDWSSKLKLLRHVSKGYKLKLTFNSDYSHHFDGFKARISMENVMQCSDDRLQMFNNSCYLFVSYPEVTWSTAQQICTGIKAQLTSVLSPDEEKFISTNIRRSSEYRTSAVYWYGAHSDASGKFQWVDGNTMSYSSWLPGHIFQETNLVNNSLCLGVQWLSAPTPILPSGLYWKPLKCNAIGGYVCKRPGRGFGLGINFNKTINGTEGRLTSPNYPSYYYNNLDFIVKIIGPERTRLVLRFEKLDLEGQAECLYDYIEIKSKGKDFNDTVKWCGNHDTDMERFDFISASNEAELRFHSDYSISASGFMLHWRAVDVSGCPVQTLTAREGTLISPNYPNSLLPRLNCSFTIIAPAGKRIWLEFQDFNIETSVGTQTNLLTNEEIFFQIELGQQSPAFRPFDIKNLLTEGAFVTDFEKLTITLKTGSRPMGRGFKAIYKTISTVEEERVINLNNDSFGALLHLNYPNEPPSNINFLQHLVAPLGYVMSLELYDAKLSETGCADKKSTIEIYDNYADTNGTYWHVCYNKQNENTLIPQSPIEIMSYLNTLHIRQRSEEFGVTLNGSLRIKYDVGYKTRLLNLQHNYVAFCNPNPCLHDGKCVSKGTKQFCQCSGHFTGLFCALSYCELEPCVFGKCVLTPTNYKCHCKQGYAGSNCEQKQPPCEGNPCESRGVCIEKGNSFHCRCHAWWEGPRCERRMIRIPYKPLSERMLEEPFWLGLITVVVVMGVIGLVWCAKRHFPEKIEKLLAEDADGNRTSLPSLRTSLRDQLAASGGSAVTATPSPGQGNPRSIFGRLGIRKPSLLSLTSPRASGYSPATARTFSLDDLLKPPRRTPSPRKKRNNSTPTKKNVAEKKQILQHLVTPSMSKDGSKKVSLGELMQLSESNLKDGLDRKSTHHKDFTRETKLISDSSSIALTDPKLEKKVTFARLLNKVSAEMSSGSEMELGIMRANRLGCAFARPSSTPPSPAADARSPNSTSSNQGSDTFSGSDLAIPSAFSCSISDLLSNRKHSKLPNGRQKPASADSILAMFRNFSSSSAGVNLSSSLKVSPSTTPTASSPQDDIVGDDDSSTSSIHTPMSYSSGAPESPILHRHSPGTIEIPVLDMLSGHKSTSGGSNLLHPPTILLEIPSTINKCLSPIREMPTPLPSPMPSPAFTPIMHRSTASSSINDLSIDSSDDRISIELPNISISDDDEMQCIQDIVIDPHAEDGLILEEAAVMQQTIQNSQFKLKIRPPPLGSITSSLNPYFSEEFISRPTPLIIPTLTIQTPSPTRQKTPPHLLGSPPPNRSAHYQETSFSFSPKKNARLKDFDKPGSLDLPCNPPMITITCNMSEAESDIESTSPAPKSSEHLNGSSVGMCYLSPFSIGARGNRTTSESNLSSSGYSSMASPGPSRCGSSNPLCSSEMEDPGPPGPGSNNLHSSLSRKPSPVLKSNTNSTQCNKSSNDPQDHSRGRSDSETLSDDLLIESNDEGIGTDHLDEKIEDGEVKSAKELEVFITAECDNTKTLLDISSITSLSPRIAKSNSLETNVDRLMPPTSTPCKSTLQLPSIIVQNDTSSSDKRYSPMSSRSESPLSDKTLGLDRFSPQFYGRHKEALPFTDSDGLYDFPSSDKVNVSSTTHHRKSTGRRREKKPVRLTKCLSPTKVSTPNLPLYHLDVPRKETSQETVMARKLSPKRRLRVQQLVSSSSSSDSIASGREPKYSSSTPSPDTIRWSSAVDWLSEKEQRSLEASGEDTGDEMEQTLHPKSLEELPKPQQKISRLKVISNQIRFLRRLETNLKRKNRSVSPESLGSGEDSPRATSPLLQPHKELKPEIRKSSSIGKLPSNVNQNNVKSKRGRYKKGELLIPRNENNWKHVVVASNGYSD